MILLYNWRSSLNIIVLSKVPTSFVTANKRIRFSSASLDPYLAQAELIRSCLNRKPGV